MNTEKLSFPYFIGFIAIGGPSIVAKLTKISWGFSPLLTADPHRRSGGLPGHPAEPTADDAIQFRVPCIATGPTQSSTWSIITS